MVVFAEAGGGVDHDGPAEPVRVAPVGSHHLIDHRERRGQLVGLHRRQVRVPHYPRLGVVLQFFSGKPAHLGAGELLQWFAGGGVHERIPRTSLTRTDRLVDT